MATKKKVKARKPAETITINLPKKPIVDMLSDMVESSDYWWEGDDRLQKIVAGVYASALKSVSVQKAAERRAIQAIEEFEIMDEVGKLLKKKAATQKQKGSK